MTSVPPIHWPSQRIILTGGAGFLGRYVHRILLARGARPEHVFVVRSREFDLTDQAAARRLMSAAFPGARADLIIHCAGTVGGLAANRERPADFFQHNLSMALNLVDAALRDGFPQRQARFLMVGSMTSYPADAPVPFRETDLFAGYPEPASAPYGIAKRAAWQLLDACHRQHGLRAAYVIPTNLYGPGDNLDQASSHFVAAVVDRCVRAHRAGEPVLTCWGTGTPTRQFLYVEDAAEGVVRAAEAIDDATPINLGPAEERSIRDTVATLVRLVGYRGQVRWDPTKPDGIGRRALDSTRARSLLGWEAKVSLEEGLRRMIEWRLALD